MHILVQGRLRNQLEFISLLDFFEKKRLKNGIFIIFMVFFLKFTRVLYIYLSRRWCFLKLNKYFNNLAMIASITAVTISPLSSYANSLVEIDGNSMNPTFKDGDVHEVREGIGYKEGDVVVAEVLETGNRIVKRIKGQKLIGDGENSKIYDLSEVTVIGVVGNSQTKVENEVNVFKASAEIQSPIDKVYASAYSVMFLHEDTSLSGFGRNSHGFFGKTNTATQTVVSEPTGYAFLKPQMTVRNRGEEFIGFKPDSNNPELYEVFKVRPGGISKHVNMSSELLKDLVYTYPSHEYLDLKVTSDGTPYAKGQEYHGYTTGTGKGHPFGKNYTGGYRHVLAPQGIGEQYVAGNTAGWNHADKTLTTSYETPQFTIPTDTDSWQIRVFGMSTLEGWDPSTLNIDIINVNTGAVVGNFNHPWNRGHIYYTSNAVKAFDNLTGTFKLKVNSEKIQFNIQVETRHYFPNKVVEAEGIGAWLGSYSLLDNQGNIHLNRNYGLVKKVNFPNNSDGTSVIVKEGTMKTGISHNGILDTQGRLWLWNSETPWLLPFPDNSDGTSFYSKYKVVDFSMGYNFQIITVENRITKETSAWAHGRNYHGQLGVTPVDYINVPFIIERNGEPLTNIQSVAAGQNFSVVVQNTSEGQLVWTAGENNFGQLGGGTTLTTSEPFIVPGITGIQDVHSINNWEPVYSFRHDTAVQTIDKTFGWGRDTSYVKEVTYGSIPIAKEIKKTGYTMSFLTRENREVWIHGNDWRCGTGGNGSWNFKPAYADTNFRTSHNGGSSTFSNVKDVHVGYWGGVIIDNNGLPWSYGHWNYAGQGVHKRSDGVNQWTCHAKPSLLDGNDPTSIAPANFQKAGGRANQVMLLDDNGKLWHLDYRLYPISSTEAINNEVIVDIFGGRYAAAVIDELGRLWTWGSGPGHGHGHSNYIGSPTLLDPSYYNNEKVIDVALLENFTLFVTESGSVFSMGWNSFGQLGVGDYVDRNRPTKVNNVQNIVQVGGGINHSLALDKDGRLWAWGYSANGSLGDNFSLTRGKISTAVGNDLPEMSIENEIKNYYLSESGNNSFSFNGTIREKEAETTKVFTTLLGVEKEVSLGNWDLDEYDKVKAQDWSIEFNLSDFPHDQTFQSLTKITAEDERGGLVEQFFSGSIIVDNETPSVAEWGDTCIVDTINETETCYAGQHFEQNGTNGVDEPVRIYFNPIQKIGDSKAPVKAQIRYRTKQPYGYPPNWEPWVTVESKNDKGFYYDFYQGFAGETQIQMRAIDEAGNISNIATDYRYVIINNAGGEVHNLKINPKITENILSNELTFGATTPNGSTLVNYGVERREVGQDEWIDLTPTRVSWSGTEMTFIDNDENLKGNTDYEYKVTIENDITVGPPTINSVRTFPYKPKNFLKSSTETELNFGVKQDERNNNEILYRLVVVENNSGQIYSLDSKSSNPLEVVAYTVEEGVPTFSVNNNSLTLKLLLRGGNGIFQEFIYDKDYINSKTITTDTNPPEVNLNIYGGETNVINDGTNKIDMSLFAFDNVTPSDKLEVQFSLDANNWYGLDYNNAWVKNVWADYKTTYKDFILGPELGERAIYARVRDEAGNLGRTIQKITISTLPNRDNTDSFVDNNIPTSSNIDSQGRIHTNKTKVILTIPKSGDIAEVQYSFDGVSWSPWEKIEIENQTKIINLPNGDGQRMIMTRYRNEFGNMTSIDTNYDVIEYILDTIAPSVQVSTTNGTRIVKGSSVILNFEPFDNLSQTVDASLLNSDLEMTIGASVVSDTYSMTSGYDYNVYISGLSPGFNKIKLEFKDKSGNVERKSVRVFSK